MMVLAVPYMALVPHLIAQAVANANNERGFSTVASPTIAESQRFAVSGTVTDAVTGTPIRKALVRLNAQQPRTTFTDGDGRFQFESVPAGAVAVFAEKPGYFADLDSSRAGTPPIEVGPSTEPIAVRLYPEAAITGKVTNATSVPLDNVPVTITYLNIRDGKRHPASLGPTNTDSDGHFRFAGLRPGLYYVGTAPFAPMPQTMLEAEDPPTSGYPGTYYGGGSSLSSATPIELRPGQQAEADFSLSEVPVFRIAGIITGYVPSQGVALQVLDASGVPVPANVQFSPDNGRFDVRALPVGEYVLRASSQASPDQVLSAENRLNLSSNLYSLHLALAPSATIPIIVTMDSASPQQQPQRPRSGVYAGGPPLSVRLIGATPATTGIYAGLEGQPGKQNLVLRNVDPGRYSVALDARQPWYVASAEYGQTNLLTDDLVISSGSPPVPINVTLRNDAASISCTVHVPEDRTTPVFIVAVSENASKALPRIGGYYPPRDKNAPDQGTVLDALAPGNYTVLAIDRNDGIEYSNPDILEKYPSKLAHVTLVPGQRAKVSLELIRTEDETK